MKKSSIAYGGNAKEEQQQRRKKSNYDGKRYNPLRNAVMGCTQLSRGDDIGNNMEKHRMQSTSWIQDGKFIIETH